MPEPLWSKYQGNYRAIAKASQILPPLATVVGVTVTAQSEAMSIRGVIRARRKAVEVMTANPDEAGDSIAKATSIEPAVARAAVRNLTTSTTNGISDWGAGAIHMDGLKRTIEVQKSIGAISGDVDATKIIDTRFLPDDLKALQ